jgi:hypothetical protein
MQLSKYKDDFILLLESGFIAVNQMDDDSAQKLFKASKLLDNKNILPVVGMGYLHFHKLELKEAIHDFEQALKMEPKNEMAKTLLGICHSFLPSTVEKGEKILQETAKSSEPTVKNLSKTTIDFVDKHIKEEETPMEAHKKRAKSKKRRKHHG